MVNKHASLKSTNVDIIILSCGSSDELRTVTNNAIQSLRSSEFSETVNFNILVIESHKEIKPYQYPGSRTIYPKAKFGFHRYVNIGIKSTKSEYVCVCNNDLIFERHWASKMLEQFSKDDTLLSASPYCPITHPFFEISSPTDVVYGYEVRKHIAGWCLFVKRDLLSKIGLFDPQYRFWYADNDFANTLQKNSVKHGLVLTSHVMHLGSATLETIDLRDQYKLTVAERFYFEHKWLGRSYNSYRYHRRKLHKHINNAEIE